MTPEEEKKKKRPEEMDLMSVDPEAGLTDTVDPVTVEDTAKPLTEPTDIARPLSQPGLAGERPMDPAPVQEPAQEPAAVTPGQQAADTVAQPTPGDMALDYDTLLRRWEEQRAEQLRLAEEEAARAREDDQKSLLFGGLAEVASNIINLMGTANGATSMNIPSQQDKLYQRIDANRREREQRRDKYRNELYSIQAQRAELKAKRQTDDRDYRAKIAQIKAEQERKAAEDAWKRQMDQMNFNLKVQEAASKDAYNQANLAIRQQQASTSAANAAYNRSSKQNTQALNEQKAYNSAREATMKQFVAAKKRQPTKEEFDDLFSIMYPQYAGQSDTGSQNAPETRSGAPAQQQAAAAPADTVQARPAPAGNKVEKPADQQPVQPQQKKEDEKKKPSGNAFSSIFG